MKLLTHRPFQTGTFGAEAMETIRISQKGKDQLSALKRKTGIPTRNVICRWAVCRSLADPSPIRKQLMRKDTALEIPWRTFAGEYSLAFASILRARALRDNLASTDDSLSTLLDAHLHRGLANLHGERDLRSIVSLMQLVTDVK